MYRFQKRRKEKHGYVQQRKMKEIVRQVNDSVDLQYRQQGYVGTLLCRYLNPKIKRILRSSYDLKLIVRLIDEIHLKDDKVLVRDSNRQLHEKNIIIIRCTDRKLEMFKHYETI